MKTFRELLQEHINKTVYVNLFAPDFVAVSPVPEKLHRSEENRPQYVISEVQEDYVVFREKKHGSRTAVPLSQIRLTMGRKK